MRAQAGLFSFQLRTDLHQRDRVEILRHKRVRDGQANEVSRRRRDVDVTTVDLSCKFIIYMCNAVRCRRLAVLILSYLVGVFSSCLVSAFFVVALTASACSAMGVSYLPQGQKSWRSNAPTVS